jgi:hypothetical protein
MSRERIEMVIDIFEDKIIQHFGEEHHQYVEYDADSAMDVAIHLADLSTKLRGDKHVPGKHMGKELKDEIIERTRMKLTQRLSIVLGTLRKDVKKTNGQAAQEIVDICLSEVF